MVTQEAIHQSLLSDGSMISEKKLKYFYIGSYLKTMSCYGGHLGFPIDKKNPNFLEDHYSGYSYQVTIPPHSWF